MPDAERELRRNAALLLGPTIGAEADVEVLETLRELIASGPTPVARASERLLMKRGRLDYVNDKLLPLVRLQHQVARPVGPTRFLVRVDEFPLAGSYTNAAESARKFLAFHEVLENAGVEYLLAVTPRVADAFLEPGARRSRPLDDIEVATLEKVQDIATLGLHGRDHRTRSRFAWNRSEVGNLDGSQLSSLLDAAVEDLRLAGFAMPDVFVPPFNRFGRRQYPTLAARFEIVCGGPETVPTMGLGVTPCWSGEAVYAPSYPPFYGRSPSMLPHAAEWAEKSSGATIPLVLHWSWEADLEPLRDLFKAIGRYVLPWSDFLVEVRESERVA